MGNPELQRDPLEPDLYGDVEQKIASQKLNKQQELADLLKSALNKNKEVSPTQAFAASALAMLPILIGKHFAGTQGAAIGAQVGGATAPQYMNALDKEQEELYAERKTDRDAEIKLKEQELQSLNKQEASMFNQGLSARREAARDERLYGQGGIREQFEQRKEARNPRETASYDPLQEQWLSAKLAGTPTTPEQDAAAAKNPALVDRGIRAQKANVYGRDVESNIAGTKIKPASTKTKDDVANAIEGAGVLGSFIDRIQQRGEVDPNFLRRRVMSELPATEQGALQDDLRLSARLFGEAITTGVMTDQDFADFKGYFTIKDLDTPESIQRRLLQFRDRLQMRVDSRLAAAEAGQENVGKLRDVAKSAFSKSSAANSEREIFKQELMNSGIPAERAEQLAAQNYGG